MRQAHLTAASFVALLDRAPLKSLSDALPDPLKATNSLTHGAELSVLAKLISLNFAHQVEGWVITLCGNSSVSGDNYELWPTFPSMLGTYISSSSKILVALDPVTPKRIVRVWEAHRPDIVVSNPNIMEFTWHNPSVAAEQPRIFDEIAAALGFRVSKHSSDRSSPSANITTGSLSRASRSPSPSPSRGWGSIPLSIILRDYRRHVFNAIETYADDKQSLCLLMEEALKPRGQSSLIQEHDLIPPYPLRWRTMTVSVRHCAEAFLSLLEDPSIESVTPFPCVSWPPILAKRVLSVKEYRTLVANLADTLRDVPSVLLTLLKEARSDGTTPNLEAMKLLPPTSFSWELMMKIIEEEVLKIIGPSTSTSDASSHTPMTSSHLEDSFMNRVLDALERNAAHEDESNSPLTRLSNG
jgi:hypothetical protein